MKVDRRSVIIADRKSRHTLQYIVRLSEVVSAKSALVTALRVQAGSLSRQAVVGMR